MTGKQKLSIHDIARIANVSIGTVDRALHGRKEISQETRKRVLRIVRELGYKPNLAARLLVVGRGRLSVGVCIPDHTNYFYNQIREGILEEAKRFEPIGVSVLFRPVPRLGVGVVDRVRNLLDNNIRALILAPGDPCGLAALIEEGCSQI